MKFDERRFAHVVVLGMRGIYRCVQQLLATHGASAIVSEQTMIRRHRPQGDLRLVDGVLRVFCWSVMAA